MNNRLGKDEYESMDNTDHETDEYKSDTDKLRFNILYFRDRNIITVSFTMSQNLMDMYKNAGCSKTYTHQIPITDRNG